MVLWFMFDKKPRNQPGFLRSFLFLAAVDIADGINDRLSH